MNTERGFTALGLLLILLLLAASNVLPGALPRSSQDAEVTARALAEGRDTVLGFALTYPTRSGTTNRQAGVGLMPCPDTRFDTNDVAGQADPPCALSSATETGLLPWRTLAAAELRDGAAAPLWYAVANAYRNNPAGIVNSDTVAGLRLDDCAITGRGQVALLLAPGAALSGQSRNTADKAARYRSSNYLELANASGGDGCFGSLMSEQANDVVLGLDREAFNQLLAQRVLAEVARALRRYQADPAGLGPTGCTTDPSRCSRAWPWLAPWHNPLAAEFIGRVGERRGLLPLRRVGVEFAATFSARWLLSSGTFTAAGAAPPPEECLRLSSACTAPGPVAGAGLSLPPLVAVEGRCTWPGGTRLRCRATQLAADSRGGAFERRWQIDFEDLPRSLVPPSATHQRLEQDSFSGVLSGRASIRVHAADFLDGLAQGEATLALGVGEHVSQFEISGIPFDLEVDDDGVIDPPTRRSPGELPAWFIANRWHQSVLVVFAGSATPGMPEATCAADTSCLELRTDRGPTQRTRAVLLLAGASLPGQERSRGLVGDWFEQENAQAGDALRASAATTAFNDRLLRLDTDD